MTKGNLETKANRAVLRIEKKVTDIDNVVRDLSMKLCHIIKNYRNNYYTIEEGIDYNS